MTEADEGPVGDEDFNGAVLRNIYEVFLEPEVAARGGREVVGPIRKGVVLLEPGAGVRVLLNDEAEVVATVRATRAIAAGEEIREADFDLVQDLRPETVPEDAGWVALAVLPSGHQIVAFDFRRNRGKGRALLALAEDYLVSAQEAAYAGRSGPCLDLAHTCAELAVTAMMYLTDDEPLGSARSRHSRRLGWLRDFTRLGNAPVALHRAMSRLADVRLAARYGDPPLSLRGDEPDALLDAVAELVTHAQERVGPPHAPDPSPQR